MSPEQWADAAFYRFGRFGVVGKLVSGLDWQGWAVDLCSIPAIQKQNPPDPLSFTSFQDWSQAFDQSITIGD